MRNQFIVILLLMKMIITGNFLKAEAVRTDTHINTRTVVSERNGVIGRLAGDAKHGHQLSRVKEASRCAGLTTPVEVARY